MKCFISLTPKTYATDYIFLSIKECDTLYLFIVTFNVPEPILTSVIAVFPDKPLFFLTIKINMTKYKQKLKKKS